MTADDAVRRIDDTLDAWERGPDAFRSTPDAEPGAREVKVTIYARIGDNAKEYELGTAAGASAHIINTNLAALLREVADEVEQARLAEIEGAR